VPAGTSQVAYLQSCFLIMSATKNNKYAAKAEEDKANTFIQMRVPKETKGAFVAYARKQQMKLTEFLIQAGIEKMERDHD
jgi:hypothetical protein